MALKVSHASQVLYYGGGLYHCKQPGLDSFFQVNDYGTGVNRIAAGPTNRVPLLFADEKVVFVRFLLDLYKAAILIIAKKWRLELEGDAMAVSEQFTRAIIASDHNKTSELSLSGFGLSNVPAQIALYRNLKTLDLGDNQLRVLFPELVQLTELEVLDVSGNKGVMLPDLSGLPNLRVLRANGCGLSEIPDWLRKCPKLESVELKKNNIDDSLDRPELRFELIL